MDQEMAEGMRFTQNAMKLYNISYETARLLVTGQLERKLQSNSVLQDWIHELPLMQQSVLLSVIRAEDGTEKGHKKKDLIKWFRRCVLKSAFTGKAIHEPNFDDGGSFTGHVRDINAALNDFIVSRDGMTLHYFVHCMHAFQILGYKLPDIERRLWWRDAYVRMVHTLHLYPESMEAMDRRLGDNVNGWKERCDPSGSCSE